MSGYLPPYLSPDVPLPMPGPDKGPVCFTFDAKWLPYVLVQLKTLTLDGVFDDPTGETQGQATQLLDIFMGKSACPTSNDLSGSEMDDCMGCCIRMRDGVLQVLQCGEWVAVDGWDSSAIAATPTQPGKGSPQPQPGGCVSFVGEVQAGNRWLLPVPVSTGDQITVTNADGTWWTPLDLGIARCPDGLIMFAGACVDGTAHTEPTDPLPTANHDNLIASDGSHFYDCGIAADGSAAVFTIGSGVLNANLLILMNTPDSSGFGSVKFDIAVCKAASTTWTHTFDFETSTGPLVIVPTGGQLMGHWVAGSGWVFDTVGGLPQTLRGIEFNLPMAARDLSSIAIRLNYANGLNDGNASIPLQSMDTNVGLVFQHISGSGPTGTNITITTAITQNAVTNIHCELFTDDTFLTPTGSVTLRGMTISGAGSDPF